VQTRTRNAIAGTAAVAIIVGGVAAMALRSHKASGGHALDAIPSGALLVATADLAALRASPVGVPFLRESREIPGLGKVRDVCGYDPMDTLTEVAVAIPAAGDAGEFGLVATGPIDDDALLACASKVIDARGGQAVTTPVGSFRSVRDASLSITGGEIAVRRGGPLLLGAGAYLRAMIDAADGRAPSIRSSVAHTFLDHAVGDASVRVSMVLTPEERRTLAEELESGGAAGSPAASIRAGALGVQLGPTVGLHAIVSCESASACAALVPKLAAARDAYAQDLTIRVVGFGAILERIKIAAEGDLVHARVELPAEQAALLADRLVTLRGLRHPMPGPSAERQPAPPPAPDEVITVDAGASKGPPDAGHLATPPGPPGKR
jgi:hypothetical protein